MSRAGGDPRIAGTRRRQIARVLHGHKGIVFSMNHQRRTTAQAPHVVPWRMTEQVFTREQSCGNQGTAEHKGGQAREPGKLGVQHLLE